MIAVAAAVGFSFLKKPIYEAHAQLLIQGADQSPVNSSGRPPDPQRVIDTELNLLKSEPVRQAIRRQFGSAAVTAVAATPQDGSDIIVLSAGDPSGRRAADFVNGYADAFIQFRRDQQMAQTSSALTELQRQLDGLQAQLADNEAQTAKTGPQGSDTLKGQRDVLLAQQAALSQRITQLRVDASLQTGGVQLVAPASIPEEPVKVSPVRAAALAALVGLFVGVGLAYLIEQLDDSINAPDDLEDASYEVSLIGTISKVEGWTRREDPILASLTDVHSQAAEGYRSLATSLITLGVGDDVKVLEVTSPTKGQGKTVAVANLGVVLAHTGRKVIAVCCDLHQPRLHEFFGLGNDVGVGSFLSGELNFGAVDGALQAVPCVDGLRFLGSGSEEDREDSSLSGPRMQALLRVLREQADVVLIDSPPLLGLSDALVLAAKVDATLVLAGAGSTTKRQFNGALALLRQVSANVIGTTLNSVPRDSAFQYGYTYTDRNQMVPRRRRNK